MQTLPQKIIQTTENTRFVFASTDTTAIYSFVIAALVGVILALVGVFLAWWYGKKSFDLTTKSFEITVAQISASIQAAKDNTNDLIKSNKESLAMQEELKRKELVFQSRQVWLNDLRDTSTLYLESLSKMTSLYIKKRQEIKSGLKDDHELFLEKSAQESINITRISLKIEFLLNPEGVNEQKILHLMNNIHEIIRVQFPECIAIGNSENIRGLIARDYNSFRAEIRKLLKIEWEKTKSLK
ncbi:hypothetical protein HMPREF0012_01791 [Acinetobacter calcoaceticus RUH2202]|uniref:hypothetical protein n=1 Tax=Acinetobacter calcoaceticus TaxID=471 RepID=UPI0001BB5364|nr:hypothetical protein [Acinetobacter calcoaceticus]EEY78922.1 hypothetical protein HMPREF0012_01791 [Acinetobacter calcoaceticus RUH2202]